MIRAAWLLLISLTAYAGSGELRVYDEGTQRLLARGPNASVLIFQFSDADAQVVIEADGASCVIDSVPISSAVDMKGFVNLTNWNAVCRVAGLSADGRFHALYWGVSRPPSPRSTISPAPLLFSIPLP
jgi:hypothetical protein